MYIFYYLFLPHSLLQPITNPATGKPYPVDELIKRVMERLGISDAELRLVYHLFSRKESAREAFVRFDVNKDGKVRTLT